MTTRRPLYVLVIGSSHLPSYKIGISQPFRYLRRNGYCTYDVKLEHAVSPDDIKAADVVIFFRTVSSESYRLLELAQKIGKRTVYAIDDHFTALPSNSALGRAFAAGTSRQTYINFLRHAQIVRVASPYFSKHLRKHFRPRRVVCFPGSVDFSLFKNLKKPIRNDDQVVIGYEGGDKESAFKPVTAALDKILRHYGDKVRLEFHGYMPSELKGRKSVVYVQDRQEYRTYMKRLYMCTWDIGLAPLENSLMHRCKTNNKFREYAACLIPGIYSDMPAYSDCITHLKTGYLVPHTEEGWYEGIEAMINQRQLREKIKKQAVKLAKEKYTVEACAKQWWSQILEHR